MSDQDFAAFVHGQFPLQPDHPDYHRLVEVVQIVEEMKHHSHGWAANEQLEKLLTLLSGAPPSTLSVREVYNRFVDAISLAYIGANRAGMNMPPNLLHNQQRARQVHELITNAWVEGVFFGILFQLLGGHRDPGDAEQAL